MFENINYILYIAGMFVRVKSRVNTTKKAIQIVKSFREGSKVRQKVIQTIGYAFDKDTIDKLVSIANHIKIKLEIEENPSLFPPEDIINSSIKKYDEYVNNKKLNVNLTDLREAKSVITGIHQVYGQIYNEIGFEQSFSKTKTPYLKVIKDIVLARLANPSSKRETVSMLTKDFSLDINLNKVYRAMDKLDDKTITKIQTKGFNATQTILGKKITIAFYDCTTLYFESFKSDELKNLGYSKDCKFNQPQVLLSLIVTEEGLPLGYDLFPGNTFEGNTLPIALEKLKNKYELKNITIISDSGLLSKQNITYIKSKGYKYIIGARLKNLSKNKQTEIISGIDSVSNSNDCDYISKYYETRLEQERLIVKYSIKRAKKEREDREQTVRKLVEKLNRNNSPKSFISNYGYKKYLDYEEGKDKVILNEEKLEIEKKWDGLSGIITNVEEESCTKLLGYYKELWQIESCFRIQKHDLKIRPIFHWNERRIKSHINICYQSFYCQQYLRYRLKLQNCKLSTEEVRKSLLKIKQTILTDITTNRAYAIPSKLNEVASKIYKIMRHKYSDIPYELTPKHI
jgi:transposase